MQGELHRKRQEEFLQGISTLGCTCAWVSLPPNRYYLTGFSALDGEYNESSGWLFIGRQGRFLLTDGRFRDQALAETEDVRVLCEYGLKENLEVVSKVLDLSVVGYEEEYVTCHQQKRLQDALSQLGISPCFVAVDTVLKNMRVIKSEEELSRMEEGARVLCQIMEELQKVIVPGKAEKEIALRAYNLAMESGAESLAFPTIVASGPNAALPHAVPSQRIIREGEPVIVDMGILWKGYCTDMTRTFFARGPEGEWGKIYKAVLMAQESAIMGITPNMGCKEADAIARGVLAEMGFRENFLHGLGHGIGLCVHEYPRLGPRSEDALPLGSVVTIEPGVYIRGLGGVRIEDMVVITQRGARLITERVCLYEP